MDTAHRRRILSNLPSLINSIQLDENVINLLLSQRIFNKHMLEDILNEPTAEQKKAKMLTDLCTRGPDAFKKFLVIMFHTQHQQALEILDPDNILIGTDVAGGDTAICDGPLDYLNDILYLKRRPKGFKLNETHECYEINSYPQGMCMIINNVDFKTRERRDGSDSDAEKLYKLFEGLGYRSRLYRNLNANEMEEKLKQLAELDIHENMDSLVVIIMTHGKAHKVLGVDEDALDIEEILEFFDNYHCPHLIGKPKMFFINACRGVKYDYGIYSGDHRSDTAVTTSPQETLDKHIGRHVGTFTDMIIGYSTVFGFTSIRHTLDGAWYIDSLVEMLLEHSWDTDLLTILQKVEGCVRRRITETGEKQTTETVLRGVAKKIYFNPNITYERNKNPNIALERNENP